MRQNGNQRVAWTAILFTAITSIITPLLGPYLSTLGYTDEQASYLFAILPLTIIIAVPIIGSLADRTGKLRIIYLALFVEIISLYLYLTHLSTATIIIARFIDALAATVLSLIALAAIEDRLDDKGRGRRSGTYLALSSAGPLLFPFIGTLLADLTNLSFPFYVSMLLLGILLLALISTHRQQRERLSPTTVGWIEPIKGFLKDPRLRIMAPLGMAAHATQPYLLLYLPLQLAESTGYWSIGIAYAAERATHLFQGRFGQLGDRYGHERFILGGLIVVAISFLLLGRTTSYPLILLLLILMGTGSAFWNVNAWAYMATEGKGNEGSTVTSYLSLAKIGGLAGFLISGAIIGWIGRGGIATIYGIMLLSITGASYTLFRKQYKTGRQPA